MPERGAGIGPDRRGMGCALIGMGVVAAGFGMAALLKLSDRIELEFFGLDLDTPLERGFWVLGCFLLIGVGWVLLRGRGRPARS